MRISAKFDSLFFTCASRPSLGAPACNRMRRAAAFTARPSTPRTNGISFGRHQPRSLRYKPSFRAPFRILDIAPAITPLDFAPRFALFLADDFFADFFAFLAMLHLPKRMDNSGCMIRRESATRNQLFPQGGSEKKSVRLASAASRCRRRLVSSRRFAAAFEVSQLGEARLAVLASRTHDARLFAGRAGLLCSR
jgi:hypothetical protein